MVTATFHFHDELNDFPAPARRRREFAVPCARGATTKHMVEALGVPHTEVGRLLVNDAPAGLDLQPAFRPFSRCLECNRPLRPID